MGQVCFSWPEENGGSSERWILWTIPSFGTLSSQSPSRLWKPSLYSPTYPTLGLSLVEALPWLDYWILIFPEFCWGLLFHTGATFSPGDSIQAYDFPFPALERRVSARREEGRQEERKEWEKDSEKHCHPRYCFINISLILLYSNVLGI